MPYWILNDDGSFARTAKRDVSDQIYNIYPDETPLISALSAQNASALKVETLQDSDRQEDPENAHGLEEQRPAGTSSRPTATENWQQRFMDAARVSRPEQQAKKHGGLQDALNYEEVKTFRSLKRDVEARALSDGQIQVPTPSNDKTPKMAGLSTLIQKHMDGVTSTLSISDLEDLLLSIVNSGGNPSDIYCSGAVKRALSELRDTDSLVVTRQTRELGYLKKDIQVVETNFGGPQNLHHHRMMPQDVNGAGADMLILEMNMVRLRPFYGPRRDSMIDKGEGPGTWFDWLMTIDSKNEEALGGFNNLS